MNFEKDNLKSNIIAEIRNEIRILSYFEDLIENDIDALRKFEGEDILNRYKVDFGSNSLCVILSNNENEMLGACWIEDITNFLVDKRRRFLLRDGFVFPEHRGNNYFEELLEASYQHVKSMCRDEDFVVCGNVILGNYGSSSNLKQALFVCRGCSIYFKKKEIFHFNFL
jgi:hypothetical protein